MSKRFILPLIVAIAMVAMLTAARGGNKAEPTLTVVPNSPVVVEQDITIFGEGFPKRSAVLIVTNQIAPVFGREPTALAQADRKGSFEHVTSFSEPGTYEVHTCFNKPGNQGWDCRSAGEVIIEVTP